MHDMQSQESCLLEVNVLSNRDMRNHKAASWCSKLETSWSSGDEKARMR